jgi:hypothetical protein
VNPNRAVAARRAARHVARIAAGTVLAVLTAIGSGAVAASAAGTANALPARPATLDRPVPAKLSPPLSKAANDYPTPYLDGCHVQEDGKATTASCTYGNLRSKTTIVLFGDSHALGLFPAVEGVAQRHAWRLVDQTMSACSPATVNEWIPDWNRVSTECSRWRTQALARIAALRPAIVLVSGSRGFAAADNAGNVLSGAARTKAWETGMLATLARLKASAGRVIMIADTPLTLVDPYTCLPQHRQSLLACTTPVAAAISIDWLAEERLVASTAGVGFVDPQLWVCPTGPCPIVIGNDLVFRNAGHLTATFAATMTTQLDRAISP